MKTTKVKLDYSGKPINIHAPKLGNWPAIDIVLTYDKDNFLFDIYLNDNKTGTASAKQVIENIENGLYIIKD